LSLQFSSYSGYSIFTYSEDFIELEVHMGASNQNCNFSGFGFFFVGLLVSKMVHDFLDLTKQGLIFDSYLSWKPYLHELSGKVSRGTGVISKIK